MVAQSFSAGVQQDITSPRGGQQRQSSSSPGSGSSKAILLNPRAEVFVSPQMRVAKVAEKEAGTTGDTTGEKGDGELTAQDGQAQHAAAPSAATPSSGSLLQTRTTDFTVVEWPSRPGQETSLSRSPTAQSQENASDEASRTLSAAGSPDRDEAGGPEGKDGVGE